MGVRSQKTDSIGFAVRWLLSGFLTWWVAAYWWQTVGWPSLIVAGFVLAALAEVPLHRRRGRIAVEGCAARKSG